MLIFDKGIWNFIDRKHTMLHLPFIKLQLLEYELQLHYELEEEYFLELEEEETV